LDVTHTPERFDDPEAGSPDLKKLFALLQDFKRKQMLTPKRFEMSHPTLWAIQVKFDLLPCAERCSTLWGIEIRFDETLPLNEIKSVYKAGD
jgi:hypothetical protein